ncbi:MAG: ribonuclease III [Jaaginema sp. PMC 1079.18]|nr:ribonuclease III [Jaaginema sp. PMC 1080.18]MEC4849770.1 ribonuclease III [Jaaginema sp. PMC 1079.18]MEC4866633.1 ribonuclease III [Jaaginema sp. PMC 1078.18]
MPLPPTTNSQLRQQALTHRSYAYEHPDKGPDNERLEFLGDAVLGFVVGKLLYQEYPDLSEAQLTRLRSALVDETQLAKFAEKIDLGEQMLLGKGAEKEGGRHNPSLLSDTFEAIMGAYFLEAGIAAVQVYIEPLFLPVAAAKIAQTQTRSPSLVDPKNQLQQWALEQFGEHPRYFIIAESGPDHDKMFTAEVRIQKRVYGTGRDRRKQEAEKRAAETVLQDLGLL